MTSFCCFWTERIKVDRILKLVVCWRLKISFLVKTSVYRVAECILPSKKTKRRETSGVKNVFFLAQNINFFNLKNLREAIVFLNPINDDYAQVMVIAKNISLLQFSRHYASSGCKISFRFCIDFYIECKKHFFNDVK